MQLGDFSDYVKANPRKYYPVVYSRGEMKRLLAQMRGKWRLMAQLQYGCGLRISELCRLRVKDVDRNSFRLRRCRLRFPSARIRTSCGTAMRRIYWRMERIFRPCRNCLGTNT